MQPVFGAVAFFASACYNSGNFRGGERVKKILSQDALKLIACVSMLLDHVGAVLLPWPWLRIVGRLAFPIYCFLLCEGLTHTRSARRYLLRLAAVAVAAELPFDLLFYGSLTFEHQNVIFTLMLGLLAVKAAEKAETLWLKAAVLALCVLAAEFIGADYGGIGVLLILGMALSPEWPLRAAVMAACFVAIGGTQIFGLLALIPLGLYSGRRSGKGRWLLNWFYPVHLAVLLLLDKL